MCLEMRHVRGEHCQRSGFDVYIFFFGANPYQMYVLAYMSVYIPSGKLT